MTIPRYDPSRSAGSFVHVTVLDKKAGPVLMRDAAARPKFDIRISGGNMRAGKLVFEITNDSRSRIHEILLIPLPRSGGSVPDTASRNAHNGASPEFLGETALEPGQSLSVKVNLLPGEYALFVNSLGLHTNMIWTSLTIAP